MRTEQRSVVVLFFLLLFSLCDEHSDPHTHTLFVRYSFYKQITLTSADSSEWLFLPFFVDTFRSYAFVLLNKLWSFLCNAQFVARWRYKASNANWHEIKEKIKPSKRHTEIIFDHILCNLSDSKHVCFVKYSTILIIQFINLLNICLNVFVYLCAHSKYILPEMHINQRAIIFCIAI